MEAVLARAAQDPGNSVARTYWLLARLTMPYSVYVVCRRGNDSQRAVALFNERGFTRVKNIKGGLLEWAHTVDPNFPVY